MSDTALVQDQIAVFKALGGEWHGKRYSQGILVINQSNRARFAFVALSIIAAAALPAIAHNAMSRATESLLQDNATANGETRETQYLEASAAAMAKMMRNMQVRPTGDVDRDGADSDP